MKSDFNLPAEFRQINLFSEILGDKFDFIHSGVAFKDINLIGRNLNEEGKMIIPVI